MIHKATIKIQSITRNRGNKTDLSGNFATYAFRPSAHNPEETGFVDRIVRTQDELRADDPIYSSWLH